jgi:hypothetical protein
MVPPVIQVHMLCFRADQPETFASIRQQWLFHAQWLCLLVGMNHSICATFSTLCHMKHGLRDMLAAVKEYEGIRS